ncbi:hypothetical protein CesoFtcFv8_027605 [Champsocephalus esox]|uniref:Uncharacterized protein n=1 Tax=Champsocephalus esox TaxID=159716 RepID=A0AAN7YCM9_9TELE|nr:hypothetical protein CesoFtcFv8_027605 [Champsocephalus esox]
MQPNLNGTPQQVPPPPPFRLHLSSLLRSALATQKAAVIHQLWYADPPGGRSAAQNPSGHRIGGSCSAPELFSP